MNNISGIIVPLFASILVSLVLKIFIEKKDERAALSFLNALKGTYAFTIFIVGLLIVYNLSNNIKTIEIVYLGWVLVSSLVFFLIAYKLNNNTEVEFNFYRNIRGKNKKKLLRVSSFISILLIIFVVAVIIISNTEYSNFEGFYLVSMVAYVFTFILGVLLYYNKQVSK